MSEQTCSQPKAEGGEAGWYYQLHLYPGRGFQPILLCPPALQILSCSLSPTLVFSPRVMAFPTHLCSAPRTTLPVPTSVTLGTRGNSVRVEIPAGRRALPWESRVLRLLVPLPPTLSPLSLTVLPYHQPESDLLTAAGILLAVCKGCTCSSFPCISPRLI